MAEIETFGLEIQEKAAKERVAAIAKWPAVKRVVALPDIHQKKHLEAPTSIAVSTDGMIIPALTTPTLGCSMGTIVTKLKRSDIDDKFLQNFYANMREHLTFSPPSRIRTLLQWLGLVGPKKGSYDFTRLELEQVAKHGAKAVLEKYNFSNNILETMENAGKEVSDLRGLVPRSAWQFSRSNIGYGFHGNHFLELQYVDEIVDPVAAEKLGIKKDQVLASYHGGEGSFAFFIGRYFSNHRLKFNKREELMRLPAKLLFHKNLFYFKKGLLAIPRQSHEGKRYMNTIRVAANYGAAFRLAMVRRIIDALGTEGKLLSDAAHTTITEEDNKIIHRNGAVRVLPGKPIIISGSDKTRSLLAVGVSPSDKYLSSADHGAGETIKKMGPAGHDFIVKTLENANLIKSVAFLKPIATFRD